MEQNTDQQNQNKTTQINEIENQEDEITFQNLITFIDSTKINYKLTSHKPTKTSQESADVRGATLASGAKAMLVKDGKTGIYALCVMSAARKLSWKLLRQVMGSKKVSMASQEDVFKITRCIPGAVPPFGSLFNIKTQLDQSLIDQGQTINFNCGLRTKSVQMSTQDFIKIESPIICNYTEDMD